LGMFRSLKLRFSLLMNDGRRIPSRTETKFREEVRFPNGVSV
jgi:hypothetical protein